MKTIQWAKILFGSYFDKVESTLFGITNGRLSAENKKFKIEKSIQGSY